MIHKDLRDFGRRFARICETFARGLGEDSQGFVRLWERIHKDLRDIWERIRKDS